ncbi:Asp-tRNA(Asn)/Glu-tRNA(Gln) amidotransferase subunit GatC [Brockia lithotrophica]|uniref:Aspartyl/glutamyl-tRNA(Asn/Gln) amidotransferase subunit C n=1 Tax=Brockia lithotrophica TaxID=933949 RepID=A0A660KUK5_9BACL|nr:Asp-tRNA(Asn)/Glu-tRNA(Gln) amidotransferase subunit GatC [Brockia lithotrophica]RKQ84734.1 aspartyl/glutamyl-tRNA(Asn/Gln) amidotransferase subunit C [Brockia lithotrophica]
MPLSPETWEKLQYLARLELTPEEKVRMERELEELLAYVSPLRQLPLDGVSPMILPVEVEPVLRADVPEAFPSREELLRSAPEVQNGFFVVPNVLEE